MKESLSTDVVYCPELGLYCYALNYCFFAFRYMKTAPSMGAVYFFYDRISHALGVGGLNRYRMASLT